MLMKIGETLRGIDKKLFDNNNSTKADQARLGFDACYKMIQQSPLLSKHIKKRKADLYFKENFGFIKPMASNTNGLDGLDSHAVIIDRVLSLVPVMVLEKPLKIGEG